MEKYTGGYLFDVSAAVVQNYAIWNPTVNYSLIHIVYISLFRLYIIKLRNPNTCTMLEFDKNNAKQLCVSTLQKLQLFYSFYRICIRYDISISNILNIYVHCN